MYPGAGSEWNQIRSHIRGAIKTLFGIEDSSGIELFVMLQRAARLSRLVDAQISGEAGLSGPRWGLLLQLLIAEDRGNHAGLTPTEISRAQRVSKNTISALLRGLETQGLIQRILDPTDLRAFRIQLTPAGRDHLHSATPRRLQGLNRLLSVLTPEEQAQLTALLEKLQSSLVVQCHREEGDPDVPESLKQECTYQ